jgi:hypothetical protein
LIIVTYAFFRTLRAIPIVFLPVLLATIITLGLGSAIYGTFNIVTVFTFAIILGLGIDFGIHCLARYGYERQRGLSSIDALGLTLRSTGGAIIVAAATTAIVFFLLMLSRFQGFAQFGALAGIGVVVALACTVILLPALVSLSERWSPRLVAVKQERSLPSASSAATPTRGSRGHVAIAWIIVLASVLAAGYSAWYVDQVDFEYHFEKLGHRSVAATHVPTKQGRKDAPDKKAGWGDAVGMATTSGPALAICRSMEECGTLTQLLLLLRRIDDTELVRIASGDAQPRARTVASPRPATNRPSGDSGDDAWFADLEQRFAGSTVLEQERRLLQHIGPKRAVQMKRLNRAFASLSLFVPTDQAEKLQVIADLRKRVDSKVRRLSEQRRKQVATWRHLLDLNQPLTQERLPPWLVAGFTDVQGHVGRYAILWNHGAKADYRDAKRLYDAFFDIPLAKASVIRTAANYYILVDVIDTLKKDGPVVLVAASIAVFLCLAIFFRSLGAALIVIAPLILSLCWLAGVFYLMHWKLNMFSTLAFPLLVGMGIDNGIHFCHRWRETPRIRVVLREVGGPLFLSTLTTVIGFSGLILSDHVGVETLGTTALLGMTLCLASAVVTLPALLLLVDRRGKSKS